MVLKVPMPPFKEAKPSEEAASDQRAGVKKKAGPPPTPPNKPSASSSLSNLTEILPSMPNSHPPIPPAKEKKPPKTAMLLDQEVQDTADEKKEKEEDSGSETAEPAVETEEADELNLDKDEDGKLESTTAKEEVSDEETPEAVSCGIIKTSDIDQQEPAAPQRKSLSPLISKKSSEEHVPPAMQNKNNPSAITQPDAPSVVVSCNDPLTDSLSLLCHLSGEKNKKKAEEKSVDSGQHSDDESEGSGCEDTLAASTAALQGSNVGLDVLDGSDDSIQISVNLRPAAELQVRPNALLCRRSQPFQKPPKPLSKPKSASISDLLSEPSGCSQKQGSRVANENTAALKADVTKLEIEVALEMEKTSELLSKAQGESCEGDMPEDLLAKALEKLKKADDVLREVNKLKLTKNTISRMSW